VGYLGPPRLTSTTRAPPKWSGERFGARWSPNVTINAGVGGPCGARRAQQIPEGRKVDRVFRLFRLVVHRRESKSVVRRRKRSWFRVGVAFSGEGRGCRRSISPPSTKRAVRWAWFGEGARFVGPDGLAQRSAPVRRTNALGDRARGPSRARGWVGRMVAADAAATL